MSAIRKLLLSTQCEDETLSDRQHRTISNRETHFSPVGTSRLLGQMASCCSRKAGRSQPVDATPSDVKVVFMRQGRRYGLSPAQKTDIWRRWKAGESLHEIGRALVKDHGSIHFLLSQHGGIAPALRHRSERTLTLAEREDIARGRDFLRSRLLRCDGGGISRPRN